MRGVGDKVLADLVGVVLGSGVADRDPKGTVGIARFDGPSVYEPGGFSGLFVVAQSRGLLGENDLRGDRPVFGRCFTDGFRQSFFEEDFIEMPIHYAAPGEEFFSGGVGVADDSFWIEQEEGVIQRIEEPVALALSQDEGVFVLLLKAFFFLCSLSALARESHGGDDEEDHHEGTANTESEREHQVSSRRRYPTPRMVSTIPA